MCFCFSFFFRSQCSRSIAVASLERLFFLFHGRNEKNVVFFPRIACTRYIIVWRNAIEFILSLPVARFMNIMYYGIIFIWVCVCDHCMKFFDDDAIFATLGFCTDFCLHKYACGDLCFVSTDLFHLIDDNSTNFLPFLLSAYATRSNPLGVHCWTIYHFS